jgi:hypothetical protein
MVPRSGAPLRLVIAVPIDEFTNLGWIWWDLRLCDLGTEARHKPFLLLGFHSVRAVVLPHPVDGMVGRFSGKDGQPCERCAGAAVSSEAANFDSLPVAGSVQEILQVGHEGLGIGRETKIGPIEVGMGPRGCPAAVQIEPEIWRLVPPIGVAGVVGHRGHVCPVGKPNRRAMHVGGRPGCPVRRSGPDSGHHRAPIGARPGFSAHRVVFDSEGKLEVDHDRSPNGNGPMEKVTVDGSVGNPNGAHPRARHLSTQRCTGDRQPHQDLFVARLDGQLPDSPGLDRHSLRITRPTRGRGHELRLRNGTASKALGALGRIGCWTPRRILVVSECLSFDGGWLDTIVGCLTPSGELGHPMDNSELRAWHNGPVI